MRGFVRVSLHFHRQDLNPASALACSARCRIDGDAITCDDSVVRAAKDP